MLIRYCACGASSKTTRFHPTRKQCEDCANAREAERARRISILHAEPIAVEPVRDEFREDGRIRVPQHLLWIPTLRSCCIAGCSYARSPGAIFDAHHPMIAQPKAGGLKCGDNFCVDLCRDHHNNGTKACLHGRGDERAWWLEMGVNPFERASFLWHMSPFGERRVSATAEDWLIVPKSAALFPFRPLLKGIAA